MTPAGTVYGQLVLAMHEALAEAAVELDAWTLAVRRRHLDPATSGAADAMTNLRLSLEHREVARQAATVRRCLAAIDAAGPNPSPQEAARVIAFVRAHVPTLLPSPKTPQAEGVDR